MTAELRSFFGLTYLISWAFLTPFVVLWHTSLDQTIPLWALIFLPGAYGPTVAALILTRRKGGTVAVQDLLRRLLMWRVSLVWYAFALFVPIAVVAVAVALSSFRPAALAGFNPWPGLSVAPLALIAALPFGPLGEELGWRGYAQPRLLRSAGLLKSSLILGVAWTFWHTPMFWFPGAAIPSFLDPSLLSVGLYLAQITAEACLLTVLYVVSGGSVLLAVLFHMSFNTAETILYRMFPEPSAGQQLELYVIGIVINWILAVLLLFWLTHRRRNYVEERQLAA